MTRINDNEMYPADEYIDIIPISEEDALNFLKMHKARKEMVFYHSHDKWFGAICKGYLRGVGGIQIKEKYNIIGGGYVVEDWRGWGLGFAIIDRLVKECGAKKIIAYARPTAARIVEKLGFKKKQTFKNGTIKYERGELNE